MTSEVEKMYENAGVEVPIARFKIFKDDNGEIYTQPPFTAEKQIELIKWLSQRRLLSIAYCEDKNTFQLFNEKCTGSFCCDFATSIATLVQCELDFCTEEEKQQIRGILK